MHNTEQQKHIQVTQNTQVYMQTKKGQDQI